MVVRRKKLLLKNQQMSMVKVETINAVRTVKKMVSVMENAMEENVMENVQMLNVEKENVLTISVVRVNVQISVEKENAQI